MTERAGRYIVQIGNVIHGVFPEPIEQAAMLKPDPVIYGTPISARPLQQELDLSGGSTDQSSRGTLPQTR